MKAPLVASSEKDQDALRQECQRLGITVGKGARLKTLQKSIREYVTTYGLWQKYCRLAELLFGSDHNIDTRTLPDLDAGISDILYQRLMHEGYVQVGAVDGGGLYEARSGDTIYVLSRTNPYNVDVRRERDGHAHTDDSCSIKFIARLAFPDVNATFSTWEQMGKPKK